MKRRLRTREWLPVRDMPIRIAVVDLPQMLAQIVTALLNKEHDFEVVQHAQDQTDLTALVEGTKTDVIILGSPGQDAPAAAERLLQENPKLKVFTITPNGRDAFRVELRPWCFPIREISSRRLAAEIRAAVAETPLNQTERQR